MSTQVAYSEKAGHFTVAQLNALFAAIKVVLDGKIDCRGDTVDRDLFAAEGTDIINVPATGEAGTLKGVSP